VEDVADLAEVVGLLLVGDLEEQALGVLDQGRGSPSRSMIDCWIASRPRRGGASASSA
jgi:hypothetical protein